MGARMVPLRMVLASDAMHQALGLQGHNIVAVFPLWLNGFFHIQFIVGRSQRQFLCAIHAKATNPTVTFTVKTRCKSLQKHTHKNKRTGIAELLSKELACFQDCITRITIEQKMQASQESELGLFCINTMSPHL